MADHLSVSPGTGATVATDEINNVHYQRVKVAWGPDGAANDATSAAPLPVAQIGSIPAGDNNIGNIDVITLPPIPAGGNAIGTVGVTSLPALPAGPNVIGTVGVNSLPPIPAGDNNIGNIDVATLPAIPAGGNLIGDITNRLRPTSNGLTTSRITSAASLNGAVIKPGEGRIASIHMFNTANAWRYLKIYDMATTPVVGTSPVAWVIPLAPLSGYDKDFMFGKYYPNGIAIGITAEKADNDITIIAVGDIHGNIDWV